MTRNGSARTSGQRKQHLCLEEEKRAFLGRFPSITAPPDCSFGEETQGRRVSIRRFVISIEDGRLRKVSDGAWH